MEGRIKNDIVNVNEEDVKNFYDKRCRESNCENDRYKRYSVTMLHNSEISKDRDTYEKEMIYPLLEIDENTTILDLGCGTGRWADKFKEKHIKEYVGIDFSQESIDLCKQQFAKHNNYKFYCGRLQQLSNILSQNDNQTFNHAIINGVFLYINDSDLFLILKTMDQLLESGSILFLKDSIATDYRLTLENFESSELKSKYNAIYRPLDFWEKLFNECLPEEKYTLLHNGNLYKHLNDRAETSHYYWIFKKRRLWWQIKT